MTIMTIPYMTVHCMAYNQFCSVLHILLPALFSILIITHNNKTCDLKNITKSYIITYAGHVFQLIFWTSCESLEGSLAKRHVGPSKSYYVVTHCHYTSMKGHQSNAAMIRPLGLGLKMGEDRNNKKGYILKKGL